MSQIVEIKVPDIGNYTGVDVIDVAVKVGDSIAVDDTLITLETDKATMDVPADHAGVVKEVLVKVGDKVSEGNVIVKVEATDAASAAAPATEAPVTPAIATTNTSAQSVAVKVPDIGNFSNVDVIEVDIKVGDEVVVDQTLVTLETDKATMDVPSTVAGKVTAVHVKIGDKVSEGSALIEVAAASASTAANTSATPAQNEVAEIKKQVAATPSAENNDLRAEIKSQVPQAFGSSDIDEKGFAKAHASPSVRKLARELGVDLARVTGSGRKGRITPVDLRSFVKSVMQKVEQGGAGASLGGGLDLLPWPKVDFSKFGEIEVKELSRIKKISGQNLARNWVMIPHVTLHEDADMTDLEVFRKQLNKEWERAGIKVSPLAFIILACVKALQEFPEFNSSLDGDNLILKKYIHIGFAADTPNGLVVPVIKNAGQKGLKEITQELADMSKRAREGKLKPQEMQGASFTISSLGGIGGTGFTPIINAPEVAILGVCKSQVKPSWNGKEFEPRLQCPLSLSFDHRVIDGAAGMRFLVFISQLLADFRRVSL
ncbi:dihydrolipoyllysine-residue acetyltransferase [Snodgrassella communis]|uniref:Acetyltransferase component of pyruvate dehydrogenase complex n=1 Tax=Snodgrassella communis TaxID=2946699 RepID=A0A836Z642_9NEIS|nr:dihydrolipoyllysine-residue acetyltransferase [Snodgrassella communis]KDN15924.1 Dihydrolipoamide acetyltransferase component of pyruvate dehydrogenase complex [Snodgrassella communis]PIT12083.1 dihydrolipoyllysine-residue acetyltransferase [Snodgrassella communis]PIT29068.1 dihydrolipoyllysine-residue acetyltransferase [Snodgrassella communis]PIT29183.1 dihydrolipoyllysine-residue acetyltransferase [Snodgrassella communis]PIT33568.1 dihydrolipoyllysine-residue acetyltransferase [Snodgrasse